MRIPWHVRAAHNSEDSSLSSRLGMTRQHPSHVGCGDAPAGAVECGVKQGARRFKRGGHEMFGIGLPEVALLLYVLVLLGAGLFVLSLGVRCVKALERIAAALEQRAAP